MNLSDKIENHAPMGTPPWDDIIHAEDAREAVKELKEWIKECKADSDSLCFKIDEIFGEKLI